MVYVYFSGTESLKVSKELASRGITRQLVSYLYLVKKGKNIQRELDERKKAGVKIFLDSGAHTLRQHSSDARGFHGKSKENYIRPMAYYDSYVDDYIKFLKKYHHYFEIFVNVDIENVVGQKKVEEWTDKIIKEVGRQPLCVWHKQGGYHLIEEYAKKYKQIGVGRGTSAHVVSRLFIAAKKYGSKVHGFALTDYKSISKWPFYSVDSTSWLVGSMYGLTAAFNGRKLRAIPKTQRRNYRHFCEKNNINFDNLVKDKNWEVDMFNACNWRNYINHVNSYKRNIGIEYWDDE